MWKYKIIYKITWFWLEKPSIGQSFQSFKRNCIKICDFFFSQMSEQRLKKRFSRALFLTFGLKYHFLRTFSSSVFANPFFYVLITFYKSCELFYFSSRTIFADFKLDFIFNSWFLISTNFFSSKVIFSVYFSNFNSFFS